MRSVLWLLAGLQAVTIIAAAIAINRGMLCICAIEILLTSWVLIRIKPAYEEIAKSQKDREQELSQRTHHLVQLMEKYQQAALTDPLTGLLNRRGGETAISQRISSSRRGNRPMSLILLDLDLFKKVNDTHGHPMGDIVLATVARALVANLRHSDIANRWGGEEMLAALPDTELEGAIYVAEKLRQAVSELRFEGLQVTASFGVAEVTYGEEFDNAYARADMQLYISKARGRNCVSPSPATGP